MAETATILYGPSRLTRTAVTAEVLTSLLQRLPAALWNQSPDDPTPQRELARVLAEQMALHLENRTILQAMHLLLEAEGLDLDALLADFGLRRYLQRPDAYARQVAMSGLFRVKATLRALEHMGDLLFDLPHVTLRTGQGEVHTIVADTHPVVLDTTYWSLVSAHGLVYALTIWRELPTLSVQPPVGLDVTPGGLPVTAIPVRDELAQLWYVGVRGETLTVSAVPPVVGRIGPEPFQVLDSTRGLWGLTVNSRNEALTSVQVSATPTTVTLLDPQHPYQAFRLLNGASVAFWFHISAGEAILSPTLPTGAVDVTPAGGPYLWLRLYDLTGRLWYGVVDAAGVFQVSLTFPGGAGMAGPQALGDAHGVLWHYGVHTVSEQLVLSDAPRVTYRGFSTALCVHDQTGVPWFWRVGADAGIATLQVSPVLWPNSVLQSPWGALGWLELTNDAGVPRYVYPAQVTGSPTVGSGTPSPWGWRELVTWFDHQGNAYHLDIDGVDDSEVLQLVDEIPPFLLGYPPPLDFQDIDDAYRLVRPAGCATTVLLT